MTLQGMIDRLIAIRDAGLPNVTGDSPVIVECEMDDELYQSRADGLVIEPEARCEEDDELIAVYITPEWEEHPRGWFSRGDRS